MAGFSRSVSTPIGHAQTLIVVQDGASERQVQTREGSFVARSGTEMRDHPPSSPRRRPYAKSSHTWADRPHRSTRPAAVGHARCRAARLRPPGPAGTGLRIRSAHRVVGGRQDDDRISRDGERSCVAILARLAASVGTQLPTDDCCKCQDCPNTCGSGVGSPILLATAYKAIALRSRQIVNGA